MPPENRRPPSITSTTRGRRSTAGRYYSNFRRRVKGRFAPGRTPTLARTLFSEIRTNLATRDNNAIRGLAGNQLVLAMFQPESAALKGALTASAEVVAEEARDTVPIDLGNLKDSIQVAEVDGRIQVLAVGGSPSWVTGEERNYAVFVEFGGQTPGGKPTPARHFMEAAYINTRSEQLNAAVEFLRSLL